jgi:uncharacterized lipoprotein YmbA
VKFRRFSTLAAVLLVGAAGGCASSPPSDFYVLTPMEGANTPSTASTPGAPLSLGVGPVKIPEYLNRAQIVTRVGPNRLGVNEFNRWGGSFSPNLSRVVAQNLSVMLGTDDVFVFPADNAIEPRYRVILSITRFDGALGENVVLDSKWIITGPNRRTQLGTGRTVVNEATGGKDYEDYVAAQSRALESLSREIAAKIKALIEAGS